MRVGSEGLRRWSVAAVAGAVWSLKIYSLSSGGRAAAVTLFLLVLFRKPGNIKCRFKSGHKKEKYTQSDTSRAGEDAGKSVPCALPTCAIVLL